MKNVFLSFLLLTVLVTTNCHAQQQKKIPVYFDEPIIMDSLSTIFLPTLYDANLFSSDKVAVFGNFYSNIIVYDFKADQYRLLFPKDTYIEPIFTRHQYASVETVSNYLTKDWVFYRVKSVDYTGNGRIDNADPYVLFVSTRNGTNLKRLTPENESIVSLKIFEKMGFALIKMVRDTDGDRNFRSEDTGYYFMKIDLKTLETGHPIEIKSNTP